MDGSGPGAPAMAPDTEPEPPGEAGAASRHKRGKRPESAAGAAGPRDEDEEEEEEEEEPDLFSALARTEPGVALEANDEADEPDPALSGAVPAAPHRTQLSAAPEERLEFPGLLFRADPLPPGWAQSTFRSDSPESPFPPEPRPDAEPPDSDRDAEPDAGKAPPESPEPLPAGESPRTQPKQAEAAGAERSRGSLGGLEWLPGPAFPQLRDVAAGSAFRREAAPAFRRAPKAKGSESRRRRAAQPEPAGPPEWAPAEPPWALDADAPEPPPPHGAFLLPEPPDGDAEPEPEPEDDAGVFTCIECSIYFRKKEHLLEHTLQHNRGAERGAPGSPAGRRRLRCGECGWAFGEAAALERHRRLHQESREKIIEEIQKLDELPDEGREARLQCPKCVFGTNSSKIFVQHAKMHVKERKEGGSRGSGLGSGLSSGIGSGIGSGLGSGIGSGLFLGLSGTEEAPAAPAGRAPSSCVLCGFPAPDERVLREHLSFAHSQLSWQSFPDDPGQPGTSRDSFSPADFFGKSERLFPAVAAPAAREGSERSDGGARKDWRGLQHARKAAPRPGAHHGPALAAFAGAKGHPAPRPPRKRAAAQDGDGDAAGPEELHEDDEDEDEEDEEEEAGGVAVPAAALELKRSFGALLRAAGSEQQRRQLRAMVPLVLLEEPSAKRRRRRRRKRRRKKPPAAGPAPGGGFLLEEPLPLDVLLLEAPLEAPLELEELLGSEGAALRNEERRCPYCPDRFHNGIGLANHVRGHLNRVGVSYNVRHFISAEEVKAIEQRFSFQKKKKKVANFDPGTFSLMRCEFCGAGFDTRAGLSSHARAHLRDFGITNWELTVSPIHILQELLAATPAPPALLRALAPSPAAPWGQPGPQHYGDVLAPDEDDLVALEVTSPPPIPKKSSGNLVLEPPPPRLGTKLSPEPPGSKAEPQDSKAPSLTTCEVCGACFETRKGLSSHARSHLRQLGVAESESSGAPIDLLYELVRHKAKPDGARKSSSPKEPPALPAAPRPEPPLNKAIKSPPGFGKAAPGSPGLRKAVPGSPCARGADDKGAKLGLGALPADGKWGPDEEAPLNLTSGAEPCRDIRCEFCGEFFENRKGLSSHARSHLRQMGVTEWYVNGSPIDTLREILARRRPAAHPKALPKGLLAGLAPLEPPRPPELHLAGLAKKAPLSPPGPAPGAASPPPTARKMFPGLAAPGVPRKVKQDQLRVEIKRELMASAGGGGGGGGGGAGIHPGEAAAPEPGWAAHDEMAPLNLSSRAEPCRDIRCEFCGEFFENRKGLSSHARSHLRQMGVTEWSVNGSPIDTLREILRKKSKPCLIKKEPPIPPGLEAPSPLPEEAPDPKLPAPAPGKALPPLALAPLGAGRPGKPGSGSGLALAPLGAKNAGAFLGAKRALPEEGLGAPGDAKHRGFELGIKARALHDKASAEACCELCGLYFENRKALASHARAHLRQFGVTEWCVNGSPIETLREWIRHRPHKAGAYRSYIQGGRPFSKKFRSSAPPREPRGALGMPFLGKAAALAAEAALGDGKGSEGAERALGTALGVVKVEEPRGNFSKFERRQARPLEPPLPRDEEGGAEFPRKLPEPRPPPRVRPVPALVPRPPQTSLVKFVGNIYTLKCRFCEVEFQGPLSIQEEWVRHLQRHILEMNFSKADPCRSEAPPEPPALPEAP